MLPRCRDLGLGATTWGTEDGLRIDLIYDHGCVLEGLLRLDLRAWDSAVIGRLLGHLHTWGARLVMGQNAPIEPLIGEVALSCRGSPAFRFVEDPERFLRRLSLGGLEDA
jgi:hypothetical protein